MINSFLVIASGLTLMIGVAHSWLGEVRLIGPLLDPAQLQGILKSNFFRGVLRFAWHLTSIAWWGIAAMLAALAFAPLDGAGRAILLIIAATFLVTGGIILATSRGRHFAWPVFVAIAVLAVLPALQS